MRAAGRRRPAVGGRVGLRRLRADNAPAVGSTARVAVAAARRARQPGRDDLYASRSRPTRRRSATRKVFVHFLDANDEMMWTDDHDPPIADHGMEAGAAHRVHPHDVRAALPVRRRRPRSSSVCTIAGHATSALKLSNEDRGDRSYKVADFELLPQTENVFVIFKDGWHRAEVVAEDRSDRVAVDQEGGHARVPQPEAGRRRSSSTPTIRPRARIRPQQVDVLIGDQVLGTVPLGKGAPAVVRKIPDQRRRSSARRHGGDCGSWSTRRSCRRSSRRRDRRHARTRRARVPRLRAVGRAGMRLLRETRRRRSVARASLGAAPPPAARRHPRLPHRPHDVGRQRPARRRSPAPDTCATAETPASRPP